MPASVVQIAVAGQAWCVFPTTRSQLSPAFCSVLNTTLCNDSLGCDRSGTAWLWRKILMGLVFSSRVRIAGSIRSNRINAPAFLIPGISPAGARYARLFLLSRRDRPRTRRRPRPRERDGVHVTCDRPAPGGEPLLRVPEELALFSPERERQKDRVKQAAPANCPARCIVHRSVRMVDFAHQETNHALRRSREPPVSARFGCTNDETNFTMGRNTGLKRLPSRRWAMTCVNNAPRPIEDEDDDEDEYE